MEVGDCHWLRPAPASGSGPAARAFHAAVAVRRTLYIHGGHVYVKEKKGLHKFDDLWALDTVRIHNRLTTTSIVRFACSGAPEP